MNLLEISRIRFQQMRMHCLGTCCCHMETRLISPRVLVAVMDLFVSMEKETVFKLKFAIS